MVQINCARDCFQKSFNYSFNAGKGQTEFGNVGVSGGSQTRELGEKSSEQGEIEHETQPTYDTRLELNPDQTSLLESKDGTIAIGFIKL